MTSQRVGRGRQVVTGEQIRAARALVRLEQAEVAKRADVSEETVKRFERQVGPVVAHAKTFRAVVKVLEDAGAEFEPATEDRGVGVRLRGPMPARPAPE